MVAFRFTYHLVAVVTLGGMLHACCREPPIGELTLQCGLVCPDQGVSNGQSSIGSQPYQHAFFRAVTRTVRAADALSRDIDREQAQLASLLGIPPDVDDASLSEALAQTFDALLDEPPTLDLAPLVCVKSLVLAGHLASLCDVGSQIGGYVFPAPEQRPAPAAARCTGLCDDPKTTPADCQTDCLGVVELPETSPECQASTLALLELSADCSHGDSSLQFVLNAATQADTEARRDARALLESLEVHLVRLARFKSESLRLSEVLEGLAQEADGNLRTAIEEQAGADDISIAVAIGHGCAFSELQAVEKIAQETGTELSRDRDAIDQTLSSLSLTKEAP